MEGAPMKDQQRTDTISAQILFEPLTTGIRCVALDENGNTLWGYVAGKERLRETHQLVAVYDRLAELLEDRLVKHGKLGEKKEAWDFDGLRQLIKKAQEMLSGLDVTYAERNLKTEEARARKMGNAPAVRKALRDFIATLDLIGVSAKSTKGVLADELPLS
jgi:hypothetical protein